MEPEINEEPVEQTEAEEFIEDLESQPEPEIPQETIALAKAMGHVSRDEWQGPDDAWVPADEFVKKTYDHNGRLRERNEQLFKKIEELETMNRVAMERFNEMQSESFEDKLSAIKARKRQAVDEGDTETFDALEKYEADLRKKSPQPIMPPTTDGRPNEVGQQIESWKAKNTWFDESKNPVEYAAADGLYARYVANHPGASVSEALDHVDGVMKSRFPELYENPNRKRATSVESGARRGSGSGGKGFASLPPEAKQAAERFVKQGLFKSKDDYAKKYFETAGN